MSRSIKPTILFESGNRVSYRAISILVKSNVLLLAVNALLALESKSNALLSGSCFARNARSILNGIGKQKQQRVSNQNLLAIELERQVTALKAFSFWNLDRWFLSLDWSCALPEILGADDTPESRGSTRHGLFTRTETARHGLFLASFRLVEAKAMNSSMEG